MMEKKSGESFRVFHESGTGSFEISGDTARLNTGKVSEFTTRNIVSFQKTGELALNKVSVELKYFDMFGNSDTHRFAMHSNDYRIAKQSLGK